MELKVYQKDGSEAGRSVTMNESVFGIEPNDHSIWLDVRRIQANGRQGTHKSKERAEIAGSTRKLYRQKGTGHARAGSMKSPLRRGGGTVFGPRPRKYNLKVNKKTRHLARRSALSYKAQADAIRVVEDFRMEQPDTQILIGLLDTLEVGNSNVLFLTSSYDENMYKSGRNIPRFNVLEARHVSTFDVLNAQTVILQEGALDSLHAFLSSSANGSQSSEETVEPIAEEPMEPVADEPADTTGDEPAVEE